MFAIFATAWDSRPPQPAKYAVFDEGSSFQVKNAHLSEPGGKNSEKPASENIHTI